MVSLRALVGLVGLLPFASLHAQQAPPPAVVHEDLQYAEGFAKDSRRNRLDVYVPRAAKSLPPLVMFVHGGGWTAGSKDGQGVLGQALAMHGIATAAINTQMFPFAKPADMVADCGHALAWLHQNPERLGYDPQRLFLMGHSAGAHLVTWLALDDARLDATGVPRAAVRGVLAFSGVYELRPRHLVVSKVFGDDPAVRREASPFVHASANDPPLWLAWAERDMACLPLSARMLRDRLLDLGGTAWAPQLRGKDHVDYVFELGSAADVMVPQVVAFVRGERPAIVRSSPLAVDPPAVVTLPRGLPAAVVRPACTAAVTVVWVAVTEAEVEQAGALARALAPFGVAFVTLDASRGTREQVAASWRALRANAGAHGMPAPQYLGGAQRGGYLACQTALQPADGLRGRIVLGSALGYRSLPTAWPDAALVDLVAPLRSESAELLLLQAEQDPAPQRDDALEICNHVIQRRSGIHPIELSATTTAAALARLGGPDDLLLPLLRAFVRP